MKSRSSRGPRRILIKRWQRCSSSSKPCQSPETRCSKSLKDSKMLLKMWQDLWRFQRGMKTNRHLGREASKSTRELWKVRLRNHPTIRGTCTWVAEVLLATYSTWCTWEGRKGWLYWWTIQSVPTKNLHGARSDSGVPEQAWIPLNLLVKLFGVWAASTLNKCLIFV